MQQFQSTFKVLGHSRNVSFTPLPRAPSGASARLSGLILRPRFSTALPVVTALARHAQANQNTLSTKWIVGVGYLLRNLRLLLGWHSQQLSLFLACRQLLSANYAQKLLASLVICLQARNASQKWVLSHKVPSTMRSGGDGLKLCLILTEQVFV